MARPSRTTACALAVVMLVMVAAFCAPDAGAQAPPAAPEEDDGPGDPVAAASPPRPIIPGESLPDVPKRAPDRVAVMSFENRANVRAVDWICAGIPAELGEKVEGVLGMAPAWGPLVVPEGPVIPATASAVAAFGLRTGARWVFTGWAERPNWDLRLAVTLWRVDAGAAFAIGEVVQRGSFAQVHAFIGLAVIDLGRRAGWRIADESAPRLTATPTKDFYAYTLVGRGLGHLLGVIGPVDRKGAERDLGRAVFIDPNHALGQRLVGELLRTDVTDPKAPARAAGKFQYAVDLRPDYVPALRAAADASAAAGKREVARDLYRRLVRLRPWDLDVRFRLGDTMWQTGDADGALRELGRVIRHAPDDLRARRVLVLIHASRGATTDLVRELEEVVRRDPADLDALADLGTAYGATGRWPDATAAWEKVAVARPLDVTAQKRMGDVWRRRGDPAAAETWYTRAAQLAPDDPRPSFLIGSAWLERGKLDRALPAYIRTQRYKDYLGYSYNALGAIQLAKNDLDGAIWYLRRAAKQRMRSRDARYNYVYIMARRGEWDGVILHGDLGLTYWADDAELLYLRGVALARKGDVAGARRALGRAITSDAGHGPARRALSALDRGGEVVPEGQLVLEHPFGDADFYRGVLDRFRAIEQRMTGLRGQIDRQLLALLAAMGEGPAKDRKAARAARRVCPAVKVARPWREAQRLLGVFERTGADLESTYRTVATLDDLGDSAALMPDYRARVLQARSSWKLALADLRELRNAVLVQVQAELKARRCSEARMTAALTQPRLYGGGDDVRPAGPPAGPPAPREPARATFFVDNRECPDPVTVWVDGELVGSVPPGERSALSALIGRRTVCLLGTSSGACGDRGSVRQAYLHDGWQVAMRCPSLARENPAPPPTPSP
jgi:tetratricopeptide (TPR) repeat protein